MTLLSKKGFTYWDCGVLALCIIGSLAWLWGIAGGLTAGTPRLSVFQGKRLLYTAPLSLPDTAKEKELIIHVREGYGGPFTLRLLMSDTGVRIAPLPRDICPDGICWRSGRIDDKGEALVCVPNKISVGLSGGGTKAGGIDAVAK